MPKKRAPGHDVPPGYLRGGDGKLYKHQIEAGVMIAAGQTAVVADPEIIKRGEALVLEARQREQLQREQLPRQALEAANRERAALAKAERDELQRIADASGKTGKSRRARAVKCEVERRIARGKWPWIAPPARDWFDYIRKRIDSAC